MVRHAQAMAHPRHGSKPARKIEAPKLHPGRAEFFALPSSLNSSYSSCYCEMRMNRTFGYTLVGLFLVLDLAIGGSVFRSGEGGGARPGCGALVWGLGRGFSSVEQNAGVLKKATSRRVLAVEEAPAAKAGIVPGDQIVAIEGVNVEHKRVEDIGPLLRGAKGSVVHLRIYRPSTKAANDIQVTREIYRVTSVRDAHLLEDSEAGQFKIGYLRITEFDQPTATELGARVDDLLAKGMQALVVDLRFNPGGLVQSAIDTCGIFLPPKTMVVYTEGRDAAAHQEFFTDAEAKPRLNFPLVILVNTESASASEIVAGAMKDLRRAIIVGQTTFGKGLVQAQFELPDGSGMRLTVARYFTPNHETIQERGVKPDILSSMNRDQERALLLRQRGSFLNPAERELVAHEKDEQLDRAVDALKGLLTYEG